VSRVRAFVAFPISEALAARLHALMRELAPLVPGLRFVRTEGLHLTLRFLGSATTDELARLEPLLQSAAARCARGEARARSLGVFPERGAPRVLWIGLDLALRFLVLQRDCEAAAIATGFAPEERPFRPHLTLGRWKDRAPRPLLPEADLGLCPLDELVLFRSDTRAGGSVYTPIGRYPLPS
jgi:RNA 2',3'-cyclic 3'-phosphodiesterase